MTGGGLTARFFLPREHFVNIFPSPPPPPHLLLSSPFRQGNPTRHKVGRGAGGGGGGWRFRVCDKNFSQRQRSRSRYSGRERQVRKCVVKLQARPLTWFTTSCRPSSRENASHTWEIGVIGTHIHTYTDTHTHTRATYIRARAKEISQRNGTTYIYDRAEITG